ncbi:glucosyltransferase [Exophiala dermatitidis]|uniref:Dol-P-Glc:Glc(2)Man(9)GlcNAc(2)-PP-Dol alpha-1,2-glucosyltransferase n=2 Tax=Exophiala dermatitidis TaxID=5970 RepID=H6BMA7_EXODN|nr:alpha-1,2-glucosyltransferase [Exophiala dermatitidis NIH/UT8656]KAJ4512206.1 glucosyltransferase [Exophiala dermatitidis]EHY52988.1 alpha-1,2-glucosyltransferase [Exophiala dermatitidis NIH/UT8656]KAJ4515109.1 glucosyltransferase [Exophiala dermatitidis]KAJ4517602.1 glucosyltransferase [Exophiala dermatitidis]KAJ4548640.1 glucosyltransferase [Exophiala dermatitidis]
MSYFTSPEFLRVLVLGLVTSAHMTWRRLVNQLVPVPYLDEFFHVPQVQAYWLGKWTQWDPKITTPPGLYIYSYIVNSIRDFFSKEDFKPSVNEWRSTNVLLLYLLLVACYILTTVQRRPVNHEGVLQREFAIILFPLIFFFSALYYTDLFSVFTVVLTHIFWTAGNSATTGSSKFIFQILHVVTGLISLATRQTNIFWVAVYLGGLQVVESVKRRRQSHQADHNDTTIQIHDPSVPEAYFGDYVKTSISLVQASLTMLPQLLLDLWPHLCLLVAFGAFVAWNGGVVLGDKDNHVATIHLAQMLYIWPLIVFFSWPVLLPQFATFSKQHRLPRLSTSLAVLALMLITVHFNTVIHPFTLADNRHYTFYVFRILRRHWSLKYAAVPVYFVCACLVLGALGGGGYAGSPRTKTTTESNRLGVEKKPGQERSTKKVLYEANVDEDDTVRVSWVLIWLVATSMSLVTAPLVEPRYFIVPWLTWRLAVPEYRHPSAAAVVSAAEEKRKPSSPSSQSRTDSSVREAEAASTRSSSSTTPVPGVQALLRTAASYSFPLELLWYLLVNLVTCYVFLYKGFEWPQEPGNVQRFMW